MAYLHSKGIFVFTAPYNAAAQLAYMENDAVISAIVGSASCLVFGADQVILDFDWDETKKFSFSTLERCVEKLGATREQFNDTCLLAGASVLPTFPDLDVDSNKAKIDSARMLLQRSHNDAVAACVSSML